MVNFIICMSKAYVNKIQVHTYSRIGDSGQDRIKVSSALYLTADGIHCCQKSDFELPRERVQKLKFSEAQGISRARADLRQNSSYKLKVIAAGPTY